MLSAGGQIIIGWIYGHLAEYALHRWFLHGFALRHMRWFHFHFRDHHRDARSNLMHDDIYSRLRWDAGGKEAASLIGILLLHLPLCFWLPWLYAVLLLSAAHYYYVHRKAHLSVDWAKQIVPWHYDHHMAPNQHANWGVRSDFLDRIFGTRVVYYGTTKERAEYTRRVRKWIRAQKHGHDIRPRGSKS